MTETTSTHSVTVSGLSTSTTRETLEHFFSFCGKLSEIKQDGTTAKISFVKESAAKTALMLNGGTLDSSTISVTSEDTAAPSLANIKPVASNAETPAEKDHSEIEQEDKPRTAIAAEYLAAGYHLGDTAIEKAIAADKQYGISQRFLAFFTPLANKVQAVAQPAVDRASEKVAEVDAQQGVSLKLHAAGILSAKYYQAALNSPFGQKVLSFYTTTKKEVQDVHEEAVRIKENKKSSTSSSTTHEEAGATGTLSSSSTTAGSTTVGSSSSQAPVTSDAAAAAAASAVPAAGNAPSTETEKRPTAL